jgi:hypothetical protein
MGQFFDEAGIDYAEVVPWNAYPWYIMRAYGSGTRR